MNAPSPEAVVQRQFEAYNARDVDAWLATYAPDARQYEHPATLLTSGHEQIRARTLPRFADPSLRAELLKRTTIGEVVIDHEIVETSIARIELICVYRVSQGLIQSASFIFNPMGAS